MVLCREAKVCPELRANRVTGTRWSREPRGSPNTLALSPRRPEMEGFVSGFSKRNLPASPFHTWSYNDPKLLKEEKKALKQKGLRIPPPPQKKKS